MIAKEIDMLKVTHWEVYFGSQSYFAYKVFTTKRSFLIFVIYTLE